MNDADARALVRATLSRIAPEADLNGLAGDVLLTEELDLDSMDFLNFVIAIAETTQVDVPERDYPQFATLDGCVRYLNEHASERPS
ncbi:MAG: acyl carrier protein [Acidimicrobiia bacterium]